MKNHSIAVDLSRIASVKNIPLDVTWEITKKCNLKCKPCYIVRNNKEELSIDEGIKLIKDLSKAKTLYLTLTGGEPFTRKDALRIWASAAQNYKMAVTIFTNGTLIEREDLEWLKVLSPFAVHISLFSTNKKIHESMTRIKGSFGKTLEAIKSLKKLKLTPVIKMLLCRENFNERNNLIKLAESLGVSWSIDPVVTPEETGGKNPVKYRLSEKQINTLLTDSSKHLIPKFSPNSPHEFICGAGVNLAAISNCGTVYPCLMYPKAVGNIRKSSFGAIWNKSIYLNKIRNLEFNDIKSCRACNILSFCSRCPGLAMLEDRNEFGPASTSCMMAKITKNVIKG
ncbi:MAG: radical SAM protein [bacterium]